MKSVALFAAIGAVLVIAAALVGFAGLWLIQ
jgi:hypothetical protein